MSIRHTACFSLSPQPSHTQQSATEPVRHMYADPRSAAETWYSSTENTLALVMTKIK